MRGKIRDSVLNTTSVLQSMPKPLSYSLRHKLIVRCTLSQSLNLGGLDSDASQPYDTLNSNGSRKGSDGDSWAAWQEFFD